MSIDNDLVAGAVDSLDNAMALALLRPVPVEGILHIMREVRERLKNAVVFELGEDPWEAFDALVSEKTPDV